MKSENFPATERRNNWTDVIFKCPRMNWVQVLRDFFSHIEAHKECLLPHYTIRAFDAINDSMVIAFRVLRKHENEELVKSRITEFLKGYDYQVDPQEGDRFFRFQQWMRGGIHVIDQHWTQERCMILNKISKFVLETISSDTTKEDREEWTHLVSNMMAMFDDLKVYHCPETVLQPEINHYKILKY